MWNWTFSIAMITNFFVDKNNTFFNSNAVIIEPGVVFYDDYEIRNENQGCVLRRKWTTPCKSFSQIHINSSSIPDSIDWRELGAVTTVKNQGNCGSCWAFSAAGAIEGAVQISTGELIDFSEQQLVDCVERMGGCNGGLMDDAFEYFESHVLCHDSDIPYDARDESCPADVCDDGVTLKGCVDVTPRDSTELMMAVSQGPVSVAIEADQPVFQEYTGGIVDSVECGNKLDHGVLIVGYGTEDETPYWIVKNSWGAQWGEDGYVRIARSISNTLEDGVCGIALQPSYPLV